MRWRQYVIATKKFYLDNGTLNASALTFYTMFALVPMLAAAIGIAKGFGLDALLNTQIEKAFPGQESVIKFLSQYAANLLAQSSGEVIAGIAVLVLFYSVYNMLCHIEKSLNEIWQVKKPRNVSRRVSNYVSLIFIGPIILILAGSLKIFIIKLMPEHKLLLTWFSNFISYLLVIFLFYWLYRYLPNTRVKWQAAFIGGVHAGIAYFLLQTILIQSQIFMTSYSAVYGSLAALPIFLIWVQSAWILVLFGAQLCFVYQNKMQAVWEIDINRLSIKSRQMLLVKITQSCIAQFNLNEPALNLSSIADQIHVSTCIAGQLLDQLVRANILIATTALDGTIGYQPAKNTSTLDPEYILQATNNLGISIHDNVN